MIRRLLADADLNRAIVLAARGESLGGLRGTEMSATESPRHRETLTNLRVFGPLWPSMEPLSPDRFNAGHATGGTPTEARGELLDLAGLRFRIKELA